MTEAAWTEGLPADMVSNEHITKHTSLESFAKSAISAQGVIAGRPQSMSDFDAPTDPAALTALHIRLGRPETVDGYKNVGEGADFRVAALKAGINQAQAESLFADMTAGNLAEKTASDTKYTEQMATAKKASEDAYRAKWGDGYDLNMAEVRQAAEHHIPEAALKELEALGITNDPWFIDHFKQVGGVMKEDSMFGHGGQGSAPRDLATVETELHALMSDKDFQASQSDMFHPMRDANAAKYRKLMDERVAVATKNGTTDPSEAAATA